MINKRHTLSFWASCLSRSSYTHITRELWLISLNLEFRSFDWNSLLTVVFVPSGVDPNKDYPTLYRYFVEVWIYLGLAWLSLFFNWKVRMVIEAHKALKKRRKLRKLSLEELQQYKESHKPPLPLSPTPNDVNIFSFLSKRQEGYNDLIKQIGKKDGTNNSAVNTNNKSKEFGRSQSCNDAPMFNGHTILNLDRSPRHKRRYSFSDRVTVAFSKSKNYLLGSDSLLLTEDHVEGDLELDQDQMYENQLDKDANLENGGVGECGARGQRVWDSKEYHPLTFQNANITFIDEENFLNNNLEEDDDNDDDSKAKLSITTCDENIETNSKEERRSESDESVFTSDSSEHSHSYEKLVEEYAKEENTEPWYYRVIKYIKSTQLFLTWLAFKYTFMHSDMPFEKISNVSLHFEGLIMRLQSQDQILNQCFVENLHHFTNSWTNYVQHFGKHGLQSMICKPWVFNSCFI